MRFFNIVFGTDVFDGMDELTQESREELVTRLAERGMLDIGDGVCDVVDITERVARMIDA